MPWLDFDALELPSHIEEDWHRYIVDPSHNIPPMAFLLRRGGVPCLYAGDLHVVTGAAKSGKSFACLAFAAAVLRGSYLGFEAVKPGGRVLWVSSGVNRSRINERYNALLRLTGLPPGTKSDRLKVLAPGPKASSKRESLVFDAVRSWRPDLLLLDGPRGIYAGPRDPMKSRDFVLRLRRLAAEVDCAVVATAQGSSEGDMRDDFDLELLYGCAEAYRVEARKSPNGGYMSVETAGSRNQPVSGWRFRVENSVPISVSSRKNK